MPSQILAVLELFSKQFTLQLYRVISSEIFFLLTGANVEGRWVLYLEVVGRGGGGGDGPEHHLQCGSIHSLSEMGWVGEKGASSPANILKVVHGAKRGSLRSQDWWHFGGGCQVQRWEQREQAEGMGTLTEERTRLMHAGGWMETTRGMPFSSLPRAVYSLLGILWAELVKSWDLSTRSWFPPTREQPGPGANNLVTLSLQLRGVTRPFDLRVAWSKTNKLSCLFRERSAKPRALEETSLLPPQIPLESGETDSPSVPVPKWGAGAGRARQRKPRSLLVSALGPPSPNTGVLLLLSRGWSQGRHVSGTTGFCLNQPLLIPGRVVKTGSC